MGVKVEYPSQKTQSKAQKNRFKVQWVIKQSVRKIWNFQNVESATINNKSTETNCWDKTQTECKGLKCMNSVCVSSQRFKFIVAILTNTKNTLTCLCTFSSDAIV